LEAGGGGTEKEVESARKPAHLIFVRLQAVGRPFVFTAFSFSLGVLFIEQDNNFIRRRI
jgi:hypothetical protein